MSDRSRCLLHFRHMEDFQRFAASLGFVRVDPKGDFEALRMNGQKGSAPLIVHRKTGATQHYTTWGVSADIARRFFAARREAEK